MTFSGKMLTPTLALALFWLSGCAATTSELTVVTDPPDATVVVTSAKGTAVKQEAAPVKLDVQFSTENPRYTITAKPPKSKAEEFVETSRELSAEQYKTLHQLAKGNRRMVLKLDKAKFRPDFQVIVSPEPKKGWTGVISKVRSFIDTAEQGGAVPTRVVELDQADAGLSGMSISPDGKRIVFAASSFETDPAEAYASRKGATKAGTEIGLKRANLRGVRVTGGGIQHITTEDFKDLYPTFSSDGRHLIFSSNRRRPQSNDILRISADGRSGIADIYVDRRGERAVSPSMAGDGTVAFALYPDNWTGPKDGQIWTVGGRNVFTTQVAKGVHPRISPDGRHIAYVGADGNIWVVGSDGKGKTSLTNRAKEIIDRFKKKLAGPELSEFKAHEKDGRVLRVYSPYSHPSWSSDSKRIVYTSMEGPDPTGRPNQDIWIMNRDGSGPQQLTTNGSVDRSPVMSPDHRHIYFVSNRGLRWAIWRIPAP